MYPEYLSTWNQTVAGYHRGFRSEYTAYQAAQRYALAHGTGAPRPDPIQRHQRDRRRLQLRRRQQLNTIADLRKVAPSMTMGAPPQFQQDPHGLPAIEQAYGFIPAGFKPLDVGEQYQALDQGPCRPPTSAQPTVS